MEQLEEAKKKREADPQHSYGPMYKGLNENGYNYDDIQSTLGNPYYTMNYRDSVSDYFYRPYSLPQSEEPYEEDGGRFFFFLITTYISLITTDKMNITKYADLTLMFIFSTSTFYTTTTTKISSTPSCSTTSSYGQC